MTKNWTQWNRKEILESITEEARWGDKEWWKSLLLIPTGQLHDSGYMTFDVIGVDEEGPRSMILSYDVVHFWGLNTWVNMDCLWPSGIFRLFNMEGNIRYNYGRVETQKVSVNAP